MEIYQTNVNGNLAWHETLRKAQFVSDRYPATIVHRLNVPNLTVGALCRILNGLDDADEGLLGSSSSRLYKRCDNCGALTEHRELMRNGQQCDDCIALFEECETVEMHQEYR